MLYYILCIIAGFVVGGLVTLMLITHRCVKFPDGTLTINSKDYDVPHWNFDLSNAKEIPKKRLLILKITTLE